MLAFGDLLSWSTYLAAEETEINGGSDLGRRGIH